MADRKETRLGKREDFAACVERQYTIHLMASSDTSMNSIINGVKLKDYSGLKWQGVRALLVLI